jgi:hypothetical protein
MKDATMARDTASPVPPPTEALSATTLTAPATQLLGGRYRLDQLLGHGGMADVYRAVEIPGGASVAVKLVRSTDPHLVRRLTQEAAALSRLDHPGLVRVLGTGVQDGRPYLVMELVEGPTLADRLGRGPLPPDRCAALGVTLADALAYVHGRDIVHRDVKPGNVLLGPGRRARLADFGIAQLVDTSSLTMTGTTLGTVAYMAPEQIEHHRVGPAADVWSLGAILLECLTGCRGFEGGAAEVLARRIAGATPAIEALPAAWRMLLGSMLDHEPERRPGAAELSELLVAPVYGRPWAPTPGAPVPSDSDPVAPGAAATMHAGLGPPTIIGAPALRRRNRHPSLALPVAALLLAVLLAAILAWALPGTPARRGSAPPKATTTTAAATTTTLSQSGAAAAFVRDLQQAEASGALSTDKARTILDQLGQALAAASQGNQRAASRALDAIDATITGSLDSGDLSAADATTLTTDVANLAGALGLPAPTITASGTAPSGPPGHSGKGDQG